MSATLDDAPRKRAPTAAQMVSRIARARLKMEKAQEVYLEAAADHRLAVLDAYETLGATELSRRLGVHRQRVYQLVYAARDDQDEEDER
jgi:hypothetical protein